MAAPTGGTSKEKSGRTNPECIKLCFTMYGDMLYRLQRKIISKMYLIENKEVTSLCKLNR